MLALVDWPYIPFFARPLPVLNSFVKYVNQLLLRTGVFYCMLTILF